MPSDIRVKICGLCDADGLKAAVDGGARYVGFVFFEKSPRNVTAGLAAELGAIGPACLDQEHAVVRILGESGGDNAAGRSGANDDVVVLGHVLLWHGRRRSG